MTAAAPAPVGLLRVVGRWDLVALVINCIVGAGIFGLPAKVHALLGAWGIFAIIACAVLMGCIVACFAEVSSRFSETGGPYAYASTAFGPFAAFLVGWLLWLARVTGMCAIAGVMVEYLSFLLPQVATGAPRAALLTAVIGGLALLHVRGTRGATRFGTAVTVAKLAPLLLFVVLGLPAIDSARLDFSLVPSRGAFSSAVLLLGFAFVGWEAALVAAGDLRDPRRDAPFALGTGLAAVAVLYVGIQIVSVGTLPTLATSQRPLADAALTFLGPAGATLIVVGAVISMIGTINSGVLVVSRLPLAMAEAGQLPAALKALHPRYRTPALAIVASSAIVLLLTLTKAHIYLLTISTIARLAVFGVTCAALPVLRRRTDVGPALITVPGGLLLPIVSMGLIVVLLTGTSWPETRDVLLATAVGALVYLLQGRRQRPV